MAKRVFGFNVSFNVGNIPETAFAVCNFLALDGPTIIMPVGGPYVGETPQATIPITSADTFYSIRHRLGLLADDIYGYYIPVIWMDSQGLL